MNTAYSAAINSWPGLFERLRRGLVGMLVLTLIGGLALAIYTSVVVLRLQNEVRAKAGKENIEAKTSLRGAFRKAGACAGRGAEGSLAGVARRSGPVPSRRFCSKRKICSTLNTLRPRGCIWNRFAAWRSVGLAVARDMALLLRPSMLDDFGLVPALNWQAKETAKRTGLHVQVSDRRACPLTYRKNTRHAFIGWYRKL